MRTWTIFLNTVCEEITVQGWAAEESNGYLRVIDETGDLIACYSPMTWSWLKLVEPDSTPTLRAVVVPA